MSIDKYLQKMRDRIRMIEENNFNIIAEGLNDLTSDDLNTIATMGTKNRGEFLGNINKFDTSNNNMQNLADKHFANIGQEKIALADVPQVKKILGYLKQNNVLPEGIDPTTLNPKQGYVSSGRLGMNGFMKTTTGTTAPARSHTTAPMTPAAPARSHTTAPMTPAAPARSHTTAPMTPAPTAHTTTANAPLTPPPMPSTVSTNVQPVNTNPVGVNPNYNVTVAPSQKPVGTQPVKPKTYTAHTINEIKGMGQSDYALSSIPNNNIELIFADPKQHRLLGMVIIFDPTARQEDLADALAAIDLKKGGLGITKIVKSIEAGKQLKLTLIF